MCKSLLLSQLLRLLKISDAKFIQHISYWQGNQVNQLQPNLSNVRAVKVPEYFSVLDTAIADAIRNNVITLGGWKKLTNKVIYMKHVEALPVCKVEIDAGIYYKNVWRLINLPIITSTVREVTYLMIHNKLPIIERLFRIGLKNDPYCNDCSGAETCDMEHFFCSCVRVRVVWQLVKNLLSRMGLASLSDKALLNFLWPAFKLEKEAVWLLTNYVYVAWDSYTSQPGKLLATDEFFGFLKFKYKTDQLGARLQLSPIFS